MIQPVILLICVVGALAFKINSENLDFDRVKTACGTEASANLIHHNPWLVYLEFWIRDYKTEVRCMATLIDSFHLITAAHCIRKPKYTRIVARLGEYDLTKSVDCVDGVCSSNAIELQVSDAIVHPDYDGKAYHDIAILRLEAPAPYTDFIRPACLPTGKLEQRTTFVASGWGEIPRLRHYSSIKKIIPLPLWEHNACVAAYGTFKVPAHIICAGGIEGIDTCRGDSGGPLLWIRERIELWGVTSIGNVNCGTKNSPGLYTNVADHLDWILTSAQGIYELKGNGD